MVFCAIFPVTLYILHLTSQAYNLCWLSYLLCSLTRIMEIMFYVSNEACLASYTTQTRFWIVFPLEMIPSFDLLTDTGPSLICQIHLWFPLLFLCIFMFMCSLCIPQSTINPACQPLRHLCLKKDCFKVKQFPCNVQFNLICGGKALKFLK